MEANAQSNLCYYYLFLFEHSLYPTRSNVGELFIVSFNLGDSIRPNMSNWNDMQNQGGINIRPLWADIDGL